MRQCIVLRHVTFEDAGTLAPVLAGRGFALRYQDAGPEPFDHAAIAGAELVVVMGGPIGVYETQAYPFLLDEIELIRQRVASMAPTLGICLGAQLIAAALGAEVAPGPQKEIGWAPVELSNAGRNSALRHLDGVHVLHWHGDNLALPAGCEHLASTRNCPVQAFRRGANVLGLQFHIELEPQRIESWLIGHTVELGKAGIDPRHVREQTWQHGERLRAVGGTVLEEWLDQITVRGRDDVARSPTTSGSRRSR